MVKIILQDIDNVSYPFREKHIAYLLEANLITQEDAAAFLKTKKPFLIDYYIQKTKEGSCPNKLIEKIYDKHKDRIDELKQLITEKKLHRPNFTESEINLEAAFFTTLEEFFKSKHYQEGHVKEIQQLNAEIKTNPELKIIGITARAIHKKTAANEFEELKNITYAWNETQKIGLDEIYFEHQKIKAYKEIKAKYKECEIICFLEDDPRNLEEFLKEGIKCVLIKFEYEDRDNTTKRLQKEYPNTLILANTPEHARELIKLMI